MKNTNSIREQEKKSCFEYLKEWVESQKTLLGYKISYRTNHRYDWVEKEKRIPPVMGIEGVSPNTIVADGIFDQSRRVIVDVCDQQQNIKNRKVLS